MQRLVRGARVNLLDIDRTLTHELRLRLRGRDVVQRVPLGCRIWAIAMYGSEQSEVLASGPLSGGQTPQLQAARGEAEVAGIILRLSEFSESSAERLLVALTWPQPRGVQFAPVQLELRSAQRALAMLEVHAEDADTARAGDAGMLLAELYRRGDKWRLRNHDLVFAGGRPELETYCHCAAGRLQPQPAVAASPAPSSPPPSTTRPAPSPAPPTHEGQRSASTTPPPAPAAEGSKRQSQGTPPIVVPPTPAPPTPPAPPSSPAASPPRGEQRPTANPASAPRLTERVAGLWERLVALRDSALESTEGVEERQADEARNQRSEANLPPRSQQAFDDLEGRLQALEQMLQRSSGELNAEAMRQQARVSTLRDTLNTLRDEALGLEERRKTAQQLGIAPPPALQELEGEIERAYRALAAAIEAEAHVAVGAQATGSRERLSRERLFLESLEPTGKAANSAGKERKKGPLEL